MTDKQVNAYDPALDSTVNEIEKMFAGASACVTSWINGRSKYRQAEIMVSDLPEERYDEYEDQVYNLYRMLLDQHGIDCVFIHQYREPSESIELSCCRQ